MLDNRLAVRAESAAMHLTEFAKALDKILDGGLVPFVQTRAADGQSWRRISLDLRDATGIRVTHETLRGWATEWAREAAA